MVNKGIMENYLTQQKNMVNSQVTQAQSLKRKRNNMYSNASSVASSSTGSVPSSVSSNTLSTTSNNGSYQGNVAGPQQPAYPIASPVVGPYGPGSIVSSQQYSSAPSTLKSLNTHPVTTNNAKRNTPFTRAENEKAVSSVSAATLVADQYERYQRDLEQLQKATANSRAQTIETTKKALYNQREAFKKRLIEAAQKLLQTVALIKTMETELNKNVKLKRSVPFAIGKIFGQ